MMDTSIHPNTTGNNVVPFTFEPTGTSVRALEIEGEPWFVARDVAETLGYANPTDALQAHCKSLKKLNTSELRGLGFFDAPPSGQLIIPERDLYRLIMRSKLPQAAALTPSDIGVRLGDKSAIKVNQLLQALGFQTGQRTAKGRTYWEPTEAGQPYAVWLDTGKTTSDGTPVRQLKWSAEIIPLLDDDTPTDGSA